MKTSKCFKFLPKFALMIAAICATTGASASAQAEWSLTLQNGETVKVACAAGATPVLNGDSVQCAQICKLETWTLYSSGSCDQGGCWETPTPVATSVRLVQAGSKSVLFQGTLNISDQAAIARELQARFAESCDIVQ